MSWQDHIQPRQVACPACLGTRLTAVIEVPGIPVHAGVLWSSEESARSCARGDIALTFCEDCGYLFNAAFDERAVDYGLRYDNALHHSAVFRRYERTLAERLVERHSLHDRELVEIGCGSARFLGLLCRLGDNRGHGFDPSHDPGLLDELAAGRVTVERAYLSDRHPGLRADFVCARHVLEHVPDPRAFCGTIRRALDGPGAVAYLEVPNTLRTLTVPSIWDLIYEHCAYYTRASLSRLLADTGFEVLELDEAYGGQFLGAEVRPARTLGAAETSDDGLERLARHVEAFASQFTAVTERWEELLAALSSDQARVVVWGAGARTMSFLNFVAGAKHVERVVDINPSKDGTFVAGTGHPIVAPGTLVEHEPDVVLVLNPLYVDEIESHLADLGIFPHVRAV